MGHETTLGQQLGDPGAERLGSPLKNAVDLGQRGEKLPVARLVAPQGIPELLERLVLNGCVHVPVSLARVLHELVEEVDAAGVCIDGRQARSDPVEELVVGHRRGGPSREAVVAGVE
mgnify:CR=1 FL=1